MTQNLQKSTYNGLIEFLSIDLSVFGDQAYYFCNSSTFESPYDGDNAITWRGRSWQCVPLTSDGWQRGGENLVRPKVTVPDFTGALFVKMRNLNHAAGAPVERIRALYADVQAGGTYGGFQTEKYLLNSVAGNGRVLTLELATIIDFQQSKTPSFIMSREFYPGLGSALIR